MLSQWQKGAASFDARSLGGQIKIKAFDLDFSGVEKYPTGGVDCDISALYNGQKHAAIAAPKGGYVFEYVPSTKKLKAFVVDSAGALVEVANETDLSALGKVSILSWGV